MKGKKKACSKRYSSQGKQRVWLFCPLQSLEKESVPALGNLSSAQQRVIQLANAQSQSVLLKSKSVNQTININHFVLQQAGLRTESPWYWLQAYKAFCIWVAPIIDLLCLLLASDCSQKNSHRSVNYIHSWTTAGSIQSLPIEVHDLIWLLRNHGCPRKRVWRHTFCLEKAQCFWPNHDSIYHEHALYSLSGSQLNNPEWKRGATLKNEINK